MLVPGELAEQYRMNFLMMHNHQYSLTEIEAMIPYERDIYQTLLHEWHDKLAKSTGTE